MIVWVTSPSRGRRPQRRRGCPGGGEVVTAGELAVEASLVAGLLLLYRLGRYLSRDQITAVAFDHATAVLNLERQLGLAIEADVQRLVLEHPWMTTVLNNFYARAHFPVTIAFLVFGAPPRT